MDDTVVKRNHDSAAHENMINTD